MASLTAHLRQPEMHAALPFHPHCPMCRQERLVGALASGGFVSLRAQAALAVSVLTLSTMAPTAVAAEPDSEHDGAAPAAQTGSSDPSQNPNFDPGGNAETLPQAPTAAQNSAPATDRDDDSGPIEQQSATNTNDPVVDDGDGEDKGQPQSQQTPQAPATQPPTPTAAQQTATPPSTAGASPAPPTAADAGPAGDPPATAPAPDDPIPTDEDAPPIGGGARGNSRVQTPRQHHSQHAERKPVRHNQAVGGRTVPPPAPALAATSTVAARAPAATAAGDAEPGDSTHRVHAGESLWSIASDVLGSSASPAQIAREVHRLWQLNSERIGTGSPDLVMVGTTLKLR